MSEAACFPKNCQRSADELDVVVVVIVVVSAVSATDSLFPKCNQRWCTLAFGNLEAK
jgi:hypothetical protein